MKTERAAEISGQFDLRPGVAVMPGGGEVSTPSGLLYKPGDVILERYEVDQVIGEGPVGVVYSALDRDTDVQVALKIVLPEYFPNRASLRRFQEWMEPARDLQHENIVRVYEVAPLSGRFAIVQQMIVGRSLAEVLAGRLPQGIASPRNEVGALLAQMGEALTYAHPDRVHGGLKPENVLILPAGLVITDFGLALALDSRAYLSGHRHRRLPTRYLAPELQTGDAIDHRADIFSLAVMGFELLVGIPFPGQADRIGDALERLPGQAREALRAALSERPGDRPQTVDDLVDGLLSAVSERTPTSPPARPGNTNVLDIEDLETVEDEGDFPEEATPENLLPAHLDHAAHGRGTPDDGGDTDPRAILPKAPSDYPGKAALPTPGRPRSKGQRAAPSLGFTLEPSGATAIPPAKAPKQDEAGPAVGGRRNEPEALIEAAPEVHDLPEIDADGKRPNRVSRLARAAAPPKTKMAQDAAEAMDFEKSLESALASAAAIPPPGPNQKKRRKRPDAPPDAEAMRNRPVAAGGEIQSPHSNPRMHLPQQEEPAVKVGDLVPYPSAASPLKREGTAQIPLPEGLGKRGTPWWIYVLIFAIAFGAVTTGLVLFKLHQDRTASKEAARRKTRLGKLPQPGDKTGDGPSRNGPVATRITPMPRPQPQPQAKPLVFAGACPADMVLVKKKGADICLDRFEYPNQKGALPKPAMDEQEAVRLCAAAGKRLCTRKEWERACSGPKGNLYSYGRRFQQGICVSADKEGKPGQAQPAGSHESCRSHWGAYDLNGNMAEWVVGGQLMGGSAAKPGPQTSCESDTGSGGTGFNGFRCCVDARN